MKSVCLAQVFNKTGTKRIGDFPVGNHAVSAKRTLSQNRLVDIQRLSTVFLQEVLKV